MKKSLSLIKFLGAGFLSLGAISISAAAMNHTFAKNQNEVDATSVDTYYSSVSGDKNNNQQGTYNSLLESINTKIIDGVSYTSYSNLKTAYAKTYVRSDGYTYDIYSDVTNYPAGSAHASSSDHVGGGYNKEHTIPQSYWGGGTEKQGTDLFIVLPSDTYVNGKRSNYPYGITSSGTSYRGTGDPTGNRLGDTTNTSYVKSGTVFEPFESRKGDLARIYFYAVAMYLKTGHNKGAIKNWNGGGEVDGSKTIFGSGTGYKSFIYSNYLNMLLDWHKNDPVSADEIKFNNAIEGVQKNRNPFIDHPSWVDIIWGGTYGANQQNGEDTSNGNAVVVNGQIEGTTPSTDPTITINPTSLTLTEGGSTSTITATISNGSGDVTWTGYDTDVITVAESGTNNTTCTVTPVAAGTTTITVSYSTATPVTCSVTVNSSGGGGGGDDPEETTDVLFAKGFGGYTTNSYSAAGTDRTGLANATNNSGSTYAMQVFNGSSGAVRGNQSGASNFSVRNTTTYTDYYISSVSLTVSGGTLDGSTSGRSVVYFGTSAYSNPSTTAPSGTSTTASPASSGQSTLTWTNTDTTKNYFILYNLKTSSTALSEDKDTALTVTWSPVSGGGDDPTPSEKVLSSIALSGTYPTTFTQGDSFSHAGMVVTASYTDSTTYPDADVSDSENLEFTGYDMSTTGQQTVTVTYTENNVEKSQTYTITVNAAPSPSDPQEGTGTINFGNGTGDVNVNSASVTGDDSLSNTWTITTEGTTSFTPNVNYSQIGSSSKPASSITFTTTLSATMKITEFSCKFGGFNGTAGTITMKVGDTTVATGSLNTTSDVTVTAATVQNTFPRMGTSLTITVTGISKGVKAYYISYTCQTWATNFLSLVTCNNGVTPPNSTNWKQTNTDYSALTQSEKNDVLAANPNQLGTKLEQAIARYVEVVNKYPNRTNYPDYLNKAVTSNRAFTPISNTSGLTMILIMLSITSTMVGFIFVGYYLKKKER